MIYISVKVAKNLISDSSYIAIGLQNNHNDNSFVAHSYLQCYKLFRSNQSGDRFI